MKISFCSLFLFVMLAVVVYLALLQNTGFLF